MINFNLTPSIEDHSSEERDELSLEVDSLNQFIILKNCHQITTVTIGFDRIGKAVEVDFVVGTDC